MMRIEWCVPARPKKQRVWVILGILLLHILVAWLVLSGTAKRAVQSVVVPVSLQLADITTPPEVPVPKPVPVLPSSRPTKVESTAQMKPRPSEDLAREAHALAPAPSVMPVAAAPSEPAPSVKLPVSEPLPVAKPVTPAAPAQRVLASIRPGTCPKPAYPTASRRLEEEGTVTLRFLVGDDGKVLQSQVENSSGFPRLDEAARTGLASCTFHPASVDGKPEQAWATIRYSWRLE